MREAGVEVGKVAAFPIVRQLYQTYYLSIRFKEESARELEKILAMLSPTDSPTDEEIDHAIDVAEDEILAKIEQRQELFGEGDRDGTRRDETGRRARPKRPRRDIGAPLMAVARREMPDPGRRRMARAGDRPGVLKLSSKPRVTKHDGAGDADDAQVSDAARSEGTLVAKLAASERGCVYVDQEEVEKILEPVLSGAGAKGPSDADLWDAQVALWIVGDVVRAIRGTNQQVLREARAARADAKAGVTEAEKALKRATRPRLKAVRAKAITAAKAKARRAAAACRPVVANCAVKRLMSVKVASGYVGSDGSGRLTRGGGQGRRRKDRQARPTKGLSSPVVGAPNLGGGGYQPNAAGGMRGAQQGTGAQSFPQPGVGRRPRRAGGAAPRGRARQAKIATLTQRVSNTKFDVKHYSFTVIVDQRRLPLLLKKLYEQNYHVMLNHSMKAVPQDPESRYYYGTNPIMEVTIEAEVLYLTSWGRGAWVQPPRGKGHWSDERPPIMPKEVLGGIESAALRGEDRTWIASREEWSPSEGKAEAEAPRGKARRGQRRPGRR